MEKDKKKIAVATIGIIGGGVLLYVLTRKGIIPPPKPAIQLIQAQWGEDIYSPGESAILTAKFKNPTAMTWTYTTFMRYTDVYTGEPVRFEQTFTLDPGQEIDVSYICTAPDSTRFIYIEAYCDDALIRTFRAPDLIVSTPTAEAFFIMLGGINNARTWQGDKYTGYYTKAGTVMNVGDAEGSFEVVGWWRVGNYGEVHDAYRVTITLNPGEKQDISYTISAAEMRAAQEEAGHSVEHPNFVLAFISTPGYAKYYTDQGWTYTSDVVHIPEG